MYGKGQKNLILLITTFLSVFITAFTIITNIMKVEHGAYPRHSWTSKIDDIELIISATSDPTFGRLPIQFCVPEDLPKYFTFFWVPLLAFEFLLLILALYKGYECFRMYRLDGIENGSGCSLQMLLLRDSILYFLV